MEMLSIILTVFFGILSIFLSIYLYKRKKYPGKIIYVKHTSIDLLDSVANNFSEIKLFYNDQLLNKNIVYVKGKLLNVGEIDISDNSINVQLPNNYQWIDIRLKCSEGINIEIEKKNNNTITIKFDLFRKEEFIQFEGLYGVINTEIESEKVDLIFSHRIANTSKISKEIIDRKKYFSRMINVVALLVTIWAFFLSIYPSYLSHSKGLDDDSYLRISKIANTDTIPHTILDSLYKMKKNYIVIKNHNNITDTIFIRGTDYNNINFLYNDKREKYISNSYIEKTKRIDKMVLILSIISLIILSILIFEIAMYLKNKRLSKLINKLDTD